MVWWGRGGLPTTGCSLVLYVVRVGGDRRLQDGSQKSLRVTLRASSRWRPAWLLGWHRPNRCRSSCQLGDNWPIVVPGNRRHFRLQSARRGSASSTQPREQPGPSAAPTAWTRATAATSPVVATGGPLAVRGGAGFILQWRNCQATTYVDVCLIRYRH